MSYVATHAKALDKVKAKGQRIVFTKTTRPVDNDTGLPLPPVTTTVTGYALGTEKGDPTTYQRLGFAQSAAPSLFVVCDTYGAVPPDLATCEWGGVPYTVRDVQPFAPDGIGLTFTVVVGT
jgi:hypothetical protein